MSRSSLDYFGSQGSLTDGPSNVSQHSPAPILEDYEKKCLLASICLGKGSVWVAKNKHTGTLVAIKIYELDRCVEEFKRIQSEVITIRKLNHPNILSHYGSFTSGHELHIYMPMIGYRSASNAVASYYSDGLDELPLALITKDVLNGIKYLQSRGIIHRSIRGSHILIDSHGRSMLSGFRHAIWCPEEGKRSEMIHSYPEEAPFNLNWESPEVLKQDTEGYNFKTDIYSLGITLCELGNAEVPYYRLEPQLMLVEKVYGREPYLYDINTCSPDINGKDSGVGESYGDCLSSIPKTIEKEFTAAAHQFVSACLCIDQSYRPPAEKLLNHTFIRQVKKYSGVLATLFPVGPIDRDTELDELGSYETEFLVREMENATIENNEDFDWNL